MTINKAKRTGKLISTLEELRKKIKRRRNCTLYILKNSNIKYTDEDSWDMIVRNIKIEVIEDI